MARSFAVALSATCLLVLAMAAEPARAETVLLDFTAANCPPCREMEPILRQLAAEGYAVRQVDVARDRALAVRLGVDSTPTFIVAVDGREWARLSGRTDRATLVAMMHRATTLAAASAPAGGGASVSPVGFEHPSGSSGGPSTFAADVPQEGRVVPIRDPFAVRPPAREPATTPAPTAMQSAPTSFAAAAGGIDPQRLLESTIRLTVADAGGKSKGTGVIVDARNGMALALTCGHLFRESAGRGPIEISLFAADAGNPRCTGVVAGELLDYDLDRDLALIRFAVPGSVAVAPVAPLGTLLEPGASVASVGCDQGADPTVWSTRLTAVNRFQGHPNVEAARAPVEGRSGGPLFNAAGQVIGICFAADPQSDEGLYASLPSIHAKLDELQLSMVYQTPSAGPGGGVAPGAALAAAAPPAASAPPAELLAVRGQSPPAPPSTGLVGSWPAAAAPTAGGPIAAPAPHAPLTPAESAALDEIARRGLGSEVICIIRPQSPDGRSEVIKISGASPAFV
ncbi:MAG TPA: trypsin-like peptidase domain-containing protein, partial [Phenylobacterium sp.]|nr:trypsin-like peptidase domain-containing protein [Phenylobacterium sp.]